MSLLETSSFHLLCAIYFWGSPLWFSAPSNSQLRTLKAPTVVLYLGGPLTEVVGQSGRLGVAGVRDDSGDGLRASLELVLHLAALVAHRQGTSPWFHIQLHEEERVKSDISGSAKVCAHVHEGAYRTSLRVHVGN